MLPFNDLGDLDMPYTVAVDLDATLAEYAGWKGEATIGKPILKTVRYLAYLKMKNPSTRVIIHTARITDPKTRQLRPEAIKAIEQWLKDNGIYYDEIWVDRGKPIANLYIDDRAINVNDIP